MGLMYILPTPQVGSEVAHIKGMTHIGVPAHCLRTTG